MIPRFPVLPALFAALLALATAAPLAAQPQATPGATPEGLVSLDFDNADLSDVIDLIAKHTNLDASQLAGAFRHLDYSEHGGAPLLGVRGVSIISHGKSSARAIKNAIKVAVRAHESRMNDHIGRRLAESIGQEPAA